MLQVIKRALVVAHRYLGIALALFFLLWFVSGFVIIYTGGMPRQTEAERLRHLPPLDLSAVNVTLQQARAIAGSPSLPEYPRLTSILARPAYAFAADRFVFADTGALFDPVLVNSQQIVASYLGVDSAQIVRVGSVETPDQWTLQLSQALPLNKYRVADGRGSEVYVSRARAQVVLHTTRTDRGLAWVGAIPHWLYFQPLRANSSLWADVVIWSSAIGTIMAVMGLALLFLQFRWRRLPRLRQAIPHRGLMRWHYLTGVLFGCVTITWVFSGLLSMGPFSWLQGDALALDRARYAQANTAALEGIDFPSASATTAIEEAVAGAAIKEITFGGFGLESWLELAVADADSHWQHSLVYIDPGTAGTAHELLSQDAIMARMHAATGREPESVAILGAYDSYYYDRETGDGPVRPLPVLRVEYADPARTVFYVDPLTGDIVYRSHQRSRLYRWLYNGLHSLDFGAFYRARPLWDVVTLFLLSGGTVLTLLGTVLAWRRLSGRHAPGR